MFRGISENKDRDRGKYQGERALAGRATQWSLGDAPHEPAQTVTSTDFTGFKGQKLERTMKIPPAPCQIVMGDTPVSYVSNSAASYNGPPESFVRMRPAKTRFESVATNYSVSDGGSG